jgi:hypothetical protein
VKQSTTETDGCAQGIAPDGLPPSDLFARCHEVLDAASSLLVNVEYLAADSEAARADRNAAADDARASIERITRIMREMQATVRRASPTIRPGSLRAVR